MYFDVVSNSNINEISIRLQRFASFIILGLRLR